MSKFSFPKSFLSWGLEKPSVAKFWKEIQRDCSTEILQTSKANKGFGVFQASGKAFENCKKNPSYLEEARDVRRLNSAEFQREARTPLDI